MSFKKWLSKTFIYYIGEELIDEINPFQKIIEHPRYPLARIYRTSFWRGLIDTFDVLVGSHPQLFPRGGRKGVLDILIFPLISRICLFYAFSILSYPNSVNFMTFILRIIPVTLGFGVLLAIALPLEMIRNLLGIALTLLLAPVVALVHCATYFKTKGYKKEIEKLEIKFFNEVVETCGSGSIYKVEIECSNEHLRIWKLDKNCNVVDGIVSINAHNAKGIEALLCMNAGDILSVKGVFCTTVDEVEQHSQELQQLLQWLDDLKENRILPLAWMLKLQNECKANNESAPKADLKQFADQIYYFAGIATSQQIKKAKKEISFGEISCEIEGATPQNSLNY